MITINMVNEMAMYKQSQEDGKKKGKVKILLIYLLKIDSRTLGTN